MPELSEQDITRIATAVATELRLHPPSLSDGDVERIASAIGARRGSPHIDRLSLGNTAAIVGRYGRPRHTAASVAPADEVKKGLLTGLSRKGGFSGFRGRS